MPRFEYEIDAKADTVIILKNPNASFAPWSLVEAEEHPAAFDEWAEPADADEGDSAELTIVADDEASESIPNDVEEDEIWYYVSRHHLILASPTLERMLSGSNWQEGIRNEKDNLYHVCAEDWDSEALLCVLRVLHLRNSQVPRTVSLEMLAKIAVLIDFYDCAEALELFTEKWIEHLRRTTPVPSVFCRDLMLWMCVAWVLRLPEEFEETTTVAIRRDNQELSALCLPITTCVDRIEELRMKAIDTVFSQLQDLLEKLRSQQYKCPDGASFECGSILYGALLKQMEVQGLLPIPTAPYYNLSVSELYTKLQRIRSPEWCRSCKPTKKKIQLHGCDLATKVMAIADPVTRLADGPKLKDFERR